MATASNLRIGHAEREATVADLREHYADGRLNLDEFNERLNAAFSAKTESDLARVTGDLPQARQRSGYVLGGGALAGAPRAAGDYGSLQGSARNGSWQGGSRGGNPGPTRFSLLSAIAAVIVAGLTIFVVVSFFVPLALFGFWTTRPLLILAAIFMFARKILRRIFGGKPVPTGRRGRWPF